MVLLQPLFQLGEDPDSPNQLSYDVVPASNRVRFLIFSVVIMLAATTLIIATKGSSAEPRRSLTFMPVSPIQTHDLRAKIVDQTADLRPATDAGGLPQGDHR